MQSKLYTALIAITLLCVAAVVAFQALELKAYGIFF